MSRSLDTDPSSSRNADTLMGAWIAAVFVAALVLGILTVAGEPLPAAAVDGGTGPAPTDPAAP